MGRVEQPALKGSRLGRLLVFLNPIVKIVLRTPLHGILSRWFLLLAWTGAKSGLELSTPISYVCDREGIWATTGDKWPSFVAGNPTFKVRQGGEWHKATAVAEPDAEISLRQHVRIFSEHGWFRFLAEIPRKDGRQDVAAVKSAIEHGRKLVRIELGGRLESGSG